MLEALFTELEAVEGPRCGWRVEHRLIDVLVIAVYAVVGEAESFEDMALYGRCKQAVCRSSPAWPLPHRRSTCSKVCLSFSMP